MISILKYRVIFITLLFAIFGQALTRLLEVDEMKAYYQSLAPLLALAVSLLLAFIIKGKWTQKTRNILKIAASVLFGFLLIGVFMYTRLFLKATFQFRDVKGNVAYYVKGDSKSYTQPALEFKKNNPNISSDSEMIRMGFEGPHNKRYAWTEDSISDNILWLITGYCLVVLLFAGLVSLLTEILSLRYSSKKTIPKKKKAEVINA